MFETVQKRHSTRSYASTAISKETLNKILESARLSPSASNIQPWHFVIVTDEEKRRKLAKSGIFARFLADSPIVIVGCGDKKASPKWYTVDVTIAMQTMVLVATDEGLGTCWVGSFNEDKVRELLNIPENFKVVALLAVGYPSEKPDLLSKALHLVRNRKTMKDIASFNEFGKHL